MRRADAGAGQHRDRQLRDHRHVDGDPVALLHAEPAQRVREAADLLEQLAVGDRARVARLALPVVGDAVAEAGGDMAVEAVDADVELAADEPLRVRRLPRVELAPRLHPVEPVALFGPEGAEALLRWRCARRSTRSFMTALAARTPATARRCGPRAGGSRSSPRCALQSSCTDSSAGLAADSARAMHASSARPELSWR